MAINYKFPVLNSNGTFSSTFENFDDIFVSKESFLTSGLWTWGNNQNGQLGLGDITHRSSPVQVGSFDNWKQISTGTFTSGSIKVDNTLWVMGTNGNAELGLGDFTPRSSPTQVGSLGNWKQVAMGQLHTMAIKTDGTLWAVGGGNLRGGMGLGDTTNRSSPVQVGLLKDWKQICAAQNFDGSGVYSAAIKTDGTLWTWGDNSYGQLGLGDTTHRSSPVQVGSLKNWKQISVNINTGHMLAVKTDGTLWGWGHNQYGQLGSYDTTHRSSPVQIGGLTNWQQISGGQYSAAAIKNDGTLWTWGYNGDGQLGVGDTNFRYSPTQVGSLTNWKLVSFGLYTVAAIKSDGTLWSWGQNAGGQLGVGDITNRSSPVQVGAWTSWRKVSAGYLHIQAIVSSDISA